MPGSQAVGGHLYDLYTVRAASETSQAYECCFTRGVQEHLGGLSYREGEKPPVWVGDRQTSTKQVRPLSPGSSFETSYSMSVGP